ncbi:hypothetical protein AVEN_198267-1 [Araneus ventricosus]|uniref:RNase H type-1 domain-containing protein n=1 Tax=Araneus ventricosus TaxID=182803 RepID=A0A4Y2F7Y2_ARAVE|nr:hypothetical protein AVEN_198267-1 [Araneus ventricosus]
MSLFEFIGTSRVGLEVENFQRARSGLVAKARPYNRRVPGNESADALAKAGADDASVPSAPLTYLELFSRAKSRNKTIWLIPPLHH